MHNYRQAALCLHGLGRQDQQWLLNRLPDSHRATLRALLDELESLGIPGDRDPLEYVDDISYQDDDTLAGALLEIESASSEHVWLVLESESEVVVKAMLAARDWSWKPGVVARFKKSHRIITIPDTALTGKLYAAMIIAFAARLRRHGKPPARNKRLRSMLWQR